MSEVGEIERATQNRIVHLLRDDLGYQYLGNWEDRLNNSNIEEKLLQGYLITKGGYPEELVKRAIYKLQTEARNYDRTLYGNNKEVYKLLRYGVEVTAGTGEKYQRIQFVNWAEPEKNDFAFAEEVTPSWGSTKNAPT